MNIHQALLLKPGQIVFCPADRGDLSYSGVVTTVASGVGSQTNKNIYGVEYVLVTVTHNGKSAVWPSNRLG